MPTPFAPRVAGAPRAPVSSSKAGLIYWPAVAAACVSSLFLMATFAGLAWIAGRAAGTPMTAEHVRVTVEIAQPPSSNNQEARPVVQASGKAHQPTDLPPQPDLGSEKLGTEMPTVPEPQTVARAGASPAGFGEPAAELTPEPGAPVKCETFGTRVQFVRNPSEAVRLAGRDRKLVFLPQISGNFEDERFTWNNAEALRANALANDEVGAYLNEHFVASYQKVGTFRIVNGQKQGGNVASYFCTPDRRVLHVVAGPADAGTLLKEARWVVETYKASQLEAVEGVDALKSFFRKAHADRLKKEHKLDIERIGERQARRGLNAQGQVHLLLAAAALVKLEQVYKVVFENILGEKVSTDPVDG